ncbi:hypothetical protein R70006_05047 [Paraburkholderia domus]|uniref:hypothetical protein n=1 Tax=Paraburkholderia domus TaxID=2793075 RepID=UPI0019142F61|nr:hypothetical protein [Paraburkholderia domus]MBK5051716.1 hypothetical protein [Burkholderia sp. R-70006]CAE6795354.1 hypothetical protein R70006_05047 [Paraburkholderia domus]
MNNPSAMTSPSREEILASLMTLGEDPTAARVEALHAGIDAAALPAGERADAVLAAVDAARLKLDKAPVETGKKPLDQLIEASQRRKREREALADRLLMNKGVGDSIAFVKDDGRTALAGPDVARPGMYRAMWFDDRGPSGHVNAPTMRDAVLLVLDEGYSPTDPSGKLPENDYGSLQTRKMEIHRKLQRSFEIGEAAELALREELRSISARQVEIVIPTDGHGNAPTPDQAAPVESIEGCSLLQTGERDGRPAIVWGRYGVAAAGEPSVVRVLRIYKDVASREKVLAAYLDGERLDDSSLWASDAQDQRTLQATGTGPSGRAAVVVDESPSLDM